MIYNKRYFRVNSRGYYRNPRLGSLHRYKYECEVGLIPRGYIIHHIDGNNMNNDISNLQLLTPSQHSFIHCKARWIEKKEALNGNY